MKLLEDRNTTFMKRAIKRRKTEKSECSPLTAGNIQTTGISQIQYINIMRLIMTETKIAEGRKNKVAVVLRTGHFDNIGTLVIISNVGKVVQN